MTPSESSEKVFFSKLLPANLEIQEILSSIRKKYDLTDIEEGDDPLDTFPIGIFVAHTSF